MTKNPFAPLPSVNFKTLDKSKGILEDYDVKKDIQTISESVQILKVDKLYVDEINGASMGVATLINGEITINTSIVKENSRIFLQRVDDGGSAGIGHLIIRGITENTEFTVRSLDSSAAMEVNDKSVFNWLIINPIA